MDYYPLSPSYVLRLRSTFALARAGVPRHAVNGYPAVGTEAQYTTDAATRILLARSTPRRTSRAGVGEETRVVRLGG